MKPASQITDRAKRYSTTILPLPPPVREMDLTLLDEKAFRDAWGDTRLRWAIAKQIRDIRIQRGWSQEELATRAETDQATIARIENPTGLSPTLNLLKRIALAFDCALICKFVAWSDFLTWIAALEECGCIVPPFSGDLAL